MNRSRHAVAGWLTAALLLVLGALVVLWGTEYKLSLYKAEPTMQMPAKLCTRSSEAATSQLQLAIQPVETPTLLIDMIESLPKDLGHGATALLFSDQTDFPLPSSPKNLPQEAFRPPPAPARVAA